VPDGTDSGAPVVLAMSNSDWLIVWRHVSQSDGIDAIYARRISPDGSTALGMPWQLNETPLNEDNGIMGGCDFGPTAVQTLNGDFVIAWTGGSSAPATPPRVLARIVNAAGVPASKEFTISDSGTGMNSGGAGLALMADGRVIVAYQQRVGGKSAPVEVYIRSISTGKDVVTGPPVKVSDDAHTFAGMAAVLAVAGSEVLVVWKANNSPNKSGAVDIYGQLWNVDGLPAPIAPVQLVGKDLSGSPLQNLRIEKMVGGSIVVAWHVTEIGAPAINARRYNPSYGVWDCDIQDIGGAFLPPETGLRQNPTVAKLPGGGFLGAWEGQLEWPGGGPKNVLYLRGLPW
jgi:hypothetical protein